MISQEHFIGYVTTTLNNTFTNNFETNGAPYNRHRGTPTKKRESERDRQSHLGFEVGKRL